MNETYALFLVIASAFTHSLWNLFTKKSIHKESFLWSIQTIACVVFMPFFVRDLLTVDLGIKQVALMIASFLFQGLYLILLTKAYRIGEMSQVYPMMRGSAALLIPIVSMILYHERLSMYGWIGLSLIVVGLFALSGIYTTRMDRKFMIIFVTALGVGLSITGYTLVDKSILGFLSPLGLLQISNISGLLFLGIPALRSGKLKPEWKLNWKTILVGSVLAPGSYLLFLVAMQLAPLSHISPIREFSIVIGSVLGILILKEKQGGTRVLFSFVITAGMITLSLWG
ncbi:DMT family transporter [Paenibacillus sp. N1-5-1-14]|uniref:DMT family transporter n=1 Tax=Paenibacillus radicibacter TaxID=2972488 RepID=UPI002158C6CD|nr:DMT family transporter [Paenibacillus radicibacter]MCR8643731.1 DMT family transporter [Paenibacillus radicibacter]